MKKLKIRQINKNSLKIIIDDKQTGILSKKDLISIIGNIDKEEISTLEKSKIIEKIIFRTKEKFLKFLVYRDRSIKEAKNYLEKLFLSWEIIDNLIDYAKKNNFLNEQRFCENYAISLYKKGKSNKFVYYKLREKGVDELLIQKTLSNMDFNEKERIKKIVNQLKTKYNNQSTQKKYDKILSYLVRNGFEYDSIKDIVKKEVLKG